MKMLAPITVNVAQSQTDSVLQAATTGRRVRVYAYSLQSTAATSFTFNSKGSGAGTQAFPPITVPNGTIQREFNPNGWFDTNEGEALTATTGAGGTVTGEVQAGLLL